MKFTGQVVQVWKAQGNTIAFTLRLYKNNKEVGEVFCKVPHDVYVEENNKIIVYGEYEGMTNSLYTQDGYLEYPCLNVRYFEFTTF